MTIEWPQLLLYCGALIVLFLTPGPVWLALIARCMSGGFTAAWPLAAGVAIGDILWPLVAVLGISWILSVFDTFMLVLRWVACGVFIAMGAMLIRHARATVDTDNRLMRPGMWAGFTAGMLAILGNPKAVLFYMGVLPGFFDLRTITWIDVALIIGVSTAIPFVGNLILAAFVGKVRKVIAQGEAMVRINIGTGMMLILVGFVIPFT